MNSKRKSNVVGPKIRRLREGAQPKITQEDMAGRLARYGIQLNQPQIAKIESGNRPLRDYELIAIARALRVPIQELFH